jgi:hypothetical protein
LSDANVLSTSRDCRFWRFSDRASSFACRAASRRTSRRASAASIGPAACGDFGFARWIRGGAATGGLFESRRPRFQNCLPYKGLGPLTDLSPSSFSGRDLEGRDGASFKFVA